MSRPVKSFYLVRLTYSVCVNGDKNAEEMKSSLNEAEIAPAPNFVRSVSESSQSDNCISATEGNQ